MQEDMITGARFMGAVTMLIVAFVLALVHHNKINSKVYNRSRWMLVFASLFLGIHMLVQFFGHYREESNGLAWTINLMCYTLSVPLYCQAILNLFRVGHGYKAIMWESSVFIVLCFIFFEIGLLTDSLIDDEQPYTTFPFFIAILFSFYILQATYRFWKEFKEPQRAYTDKQFKLRQDSMHYLSVPVKILAVILLSVPWVGMLGNLFFQSIYAMVTFVFLLWFDFRFYLLGFAVEE